MGGISRSKLWMLVIFAMILLIACTPEQTREPRPGEQICTGARPEVCMQVYEPVCGDNERTYSNGCVACSDAAVSSYVDGECA